MEDRTVIEDTCVICGTLYVLPIPDRWKQGTHLFTCSDSCQQKWLKQGGNAYITKKKKENR